MVIHLLVLGGIVSHEGTSCHHHVGTCSVESLVDKEIFLLPTEVADNLPDFRVEVPGNSGGSLVDCKKSLLERHFVVKGLTCVGDEHCRNHQSVPKDEDRRSRIPGRVASCLEGASDASRREGTCIRFLLDQQLAGELLDHSALSVMLDETVVLFCSTFCQRLEPMGVVSHSQADSPLLHALGNGISHRTVKRRSIVDDITHLVVSFGRKILIHLLLVEDELSEILAWTL